MYDGALYEGHCICQIRKAPLGGGDLRRCQGRDMKKRRPTEAALTIILSFRIRIGGVSHRWCFIGMAKSSKLVAAKRGRVLLVRRKRDGLWMFPGGRKRARESDRDCLRREIKEELPKLKLDALGFGRKLKPRTVVGPENE